MQLTLRILTYRNQPVPQGPAVRFGPEGGSIGRSVENALVLDDPSKYISRVHARVSIEDGAYVLEDLGSNASVVNDRPLGKGCQVKLAHGDRVLIGDYLLQAVVDTAPVAPVLAPAPPNDMALPLFEPPAPTPPAAPPPLEPTVPSAARAAAPSVALPDPFASGALLDVAPGQQAADDPLGLNLLAPAPTIPARAAESDHLSPELAALPPGARTPGIAFPASQPAAGGGFAIPHDYDPLADLIAPKPAAPNAPAQARAPAPPASEPAPAPGPAPAPAPAAPPSTPAAARTRAVAADPPAESAVHDDKVMAALLRGLGLTELRPQRPAAEVAEIVGAMLREATSGTIDVLMARALTKKESRIEMTMLAVNANNPLKFFPNAESALTQMLTGTMSGYMPPVDAMREAFDDLRAHELAVIAGMRAALGAVLERFDPRRIEARLEIPTVMDKMLAANRKAKLWDRLVTLYAELACEADDELQRLYGEKFSEAYEEQVARLRDARR